MPIADPVSHVVVIMLENQSFDRLLGCMRAFDPMIDGVDPSTPRANADPLSGQSVRQATTNARGARLDPGHDLDDTLRQVAGGECSGFVSDFVQKYPRSTPADRQEVMGYYAMDTLPALHALARSFAVCDHWFSSLPGPTWPNRLFVHSGTSLGHTKMPEGFHPNFHVYDQPTVYQRLQERGLPWRIYYQDFAQSLVLSHQWPHKTHYHRLDRFFMDAAGDARDFPAYCFIEPKYFGAHADDQHPPHDMMRGDALLARVYNSLRVNEALWMSSLLVVLYDEHGGFFDHLAPPEAVPPDEHTAEFAFDQYGVRVPAVLVSPWVDRSVVPTTFDHTSVLKYVSDKWDLGPLGNRVAFANSFAPALLTRSAPRADTPLSIPVSAVEAATAEAEMNQNQNCLLSFSHFLEAVLGPTRPAGVLADRNRRVFRGATQGEVARERLEDFLSDPVEVSPNAAPTGK